MNNIYDRPATEITLSEPCFETSKPASLVKVEYTVPDGDLMVYFYVTIRAVDEGLMDKSVYDLCDRYSYTPFNGISKTFTEFVVTNNRLPRPEELEKIILMDVLQ